MAVAGTRWPLSLGLRGSITSCPEQQFVQLRADSADGKQGVQGVSAPAEGAEGYLHFPLFSEGTTRVSQALLCSRAQMQPEGSKGSFVLS